MRILCTKVTQSLLAIRFQYLTPRIRLTPNDLSDTVLANPKMLHFICSPARALTITSEVEAQGWKPITIYEPIPVCALHADSTWNQLSLIFVKDRCIPEELPSLKKVLHLISILRSVHEVNH